MILEQRTSQLILELQKASIEFIVVGGAAAVLQGAPIVTADIDIVHRRTPENVTRLLHLLHQLNAYFRSDLANRRLIPTEIHLSGHGHIHLATDLGPLDLLCELADKRGYDELISHTIHSNYGDAPVLVLNLFTLIEVKRAAGRAKDRMVLPILIATLEEQNKEQTG